MKIKININGRTYNSLEEVPPELRRFLDKDGDGVLDVFQEMPDSGEEEEQAEVKKKAYYPVGRDSGAGQNLDEVEKLLADRDGDGVMDTLQKRRGSSTARVTTRESRSWTVNGKTYHSLEEMPAEIRAALQKAEAGNSQYPPDSSSSSKRLTPEPRGLREPIRPESGFSLKGWLRRLFGKK